MSFLSPLLQISERFLSTRFWSMYLELKHARPSRETQERSLTELLRHAQASVPYWSHRIAANPNLPSNAQSLDCCVNSTCSKQDLRQGFPEYVTASQSNPENWRYGATSGTASRVTVISDFPKRDRIRATNLYVIDRLLGDPFAARIVEIPPEACNVVCALRDEGPPDLWPYIHWAIKQKRLFRKETHSDLRGRIERAFIIRQDTLPPLGSKSFLDMQPELDSCLDHILKTKANLVRGLPIYLLWLAERAKQRELSFPSLRYLMPYGGLTASSLAARLEQSFQVPFIDYYGTSEVGGIAMGEPGKQGLRVLASLMLVEVLDEHNQPLPPGKVGRIVITDFYNYAMPIIRYEIGDAGMWIHNTETRDQFELSREAELQLVGRTHECTNRNGQWINMRDLINPVFSHDTILNVAIEMSSRERARAKIMASQSLDSSILSQLQEQIASHLQCPCTIKQVPYLQPESSGKYRFFAPRGTMGDSHDMR